MRPKNAIGKTLSSSPSFRSNPIRTITGPMIRRQKSSRQVGVCGSALEHAPVPRKTSRIRRSRSRRLKRPLAPARRSAAVCGGLGSRAKKEPKKAYRDFQAIRRKGVVQGQSRQALMSWPHGLRLQRSVHHPVRDTLAWLLTAVLGERMVIRETPDGGGRMGSFMRRFPGLGHQPDIVLEGFDGRDSYTILEVKTCEPAGDAYIARQHTDTSRGAAHRHLERTLAPSQYAIPAHRPGAPRLRLLTFAVSVRGALGSEAQSFIRQLSARMAGAVPYRLLDEASWATQGCAPLLRSAIAFSARRALAAGIRRSTCSAAEATYVQRCDDQPPPRPGRPAGRRAASTARLTRLLPISDLLRVPGGSMLR